VQKDAAAHLLRITAPGYIEHDAFIKFDESHQLSVQLKRAPRTRSDAHGEDRAQPGRDHLIESRSPYR
ncbi:MAG TPA: hypothetical protein VFT22_24070, partial [Kofleriaceae bacterium]|nr:hypothetical protein [Kofleriaceae bacterium]